MPTNTRQGEAVSVAAELLSTISVSTGYNPASTYLQIFDANHELRPLAANERLLLDSMVVSGGAQNGEQPGIVFDFRLFASLADFINEAVNGPDTSTRPLLVLSNENPQGINGDPAAAGAPSAEWHTDGEGLACLRGQAPVAANMWQSDSPSPIWVTGTGHVILDGGQVQRPSWCEKLTGGKGGNF